METLIKMFIFRQWATQLLTITLKICDILVSKYLEKRGRNSDLKRLEEDRQVTDAIARGDTVAVGEIIKKRKKYKALIHDKSSKKGK